MRRGASGLGRGGLQLHSQFTRSIVTPALEGKCHGRQTRRIIAAAPLPPVRRICLGQLTPRHLRRMVAGTAAPRPLLSESGGGGEWYCHDGPGRSVER